MTSPTAGLVPERDQSPVPERDYSSPRAGLVLVPERDLTSPTAGHVVHPLTPSKPSTTFSSARTPKATTSRGTRIPADFAITPEMAEWGKTNAPDIHGVNETARFVDYWRAQPGQRGVKTDWPATWRNWMRRAQDDTRPTNGRRIAAGGHQPYRNPADISAYHGEL